MDESINKRSKGQGENLGMALKRSRKDLGEAKKMPREGKGMERYEKDLGSSVWMDTKLECKKEHHRNDEISRNFSTSDQIKKL
jgi:hypothetical protein